MSRTALYALLREHAWNATAYQIINPGIEHWLAEDGRGVVGFVERAGVRVVAGAPVCAESELESVVGEFEADSPRVCYFGAAGRIFDLLAPRLGYSVVVLGAQPVWNPQHWPERAQLPSSLRAQLARTRNKGVTVREWHWKDAENDPRLKVVLARWLAQKQIPSMHFLVEPQTLSALMDKRIFVAEQAGEPIGFVNLAPIPTRHGWLTEQFVRLPTAPNGTVESMIDAALRAVAKDGAEYFTMGLVPLAERNWDPTHYNPLWLRFVLGWVRAHGRRFYHFAGLEQFKAKLRPEYWEPIYAISKERRFSVRTLYAIAAAFSDRSPISMVVRGAAKALRQELRSLSGVRRTRPALPADPRSSPSSQTPPPRVLAMRDQPPRA